MRIASSAKQRRAAQNGKSARACVDRVFCAPSCVVFRERTHTHTSIQGHPPTEGGGGHALSATKIEKNTTNSWYRNSAARRSEIGVPPVYPPIHVNARPCMIQAQCLLHKDIHVLLRGYTTTASQRVVSPQESSVDINGYDFFFFYPPLIVQSTETSRSSCTKQFRSPCACTVGSHIISKAATPFLTKRIWWHTYDMVTEYSMQMMML